MLSRVALWPRARDLSFWAQVARSGRCLWSPGALTAAIYGVLRMARVQGYMARERVARPRLFLVARGARQASGTISSGAWRVGARSGPPWRGTRVRDILVARGDVALRPGLQCA